MVSVLREEEVRLRSHHGVDDRDAPVLLRQPGRPAPVGPRVDDQVTSANELPITFRLRLGDTSELRRHPELSYREGWELGLADLLIALDHDGADRGHDEVGAFQQ